MNMIKLNHKPTGRALIISEQHAASLLKRKQGDYEMVEMTAPPVVAEAPEEVTDTSEEVEVTKKKTQKKSK